jgi:uncharacterized protein
MLTVKSLLVKEEMSAKINSLSKPELIALLLYVPGQQGKIGEPIVGSTRLMKIIFLLFEEAKVKELKSTNNSFVAFRFGPYDSEVYDAIEALRILGLVESNKSQDSENSDETELKTDDQTYFKLTDKGLARIQKMVDKISPELYKILSNYKATYGQKSLSEILQYVYNRYPDYAKRSEVAYKY